MNNAPKSDLCEQDLLPMALPLNNIPLRPQRTDQAVIAIAVASQIKEVLQWVETPKATESEMTEIIAELTKAASTHPNDTLLMAEYLKDKHHWDINRSLIDVLDDLDSAIFHGERKAVSDWVKLYAIAPGRSIGEPITFNQNGKEVSGEISAVDEVRATYTVFCPTDGHVRSGIGVHGYIIPFEDLDDPLRSRHGRT